MHICVVSSYINFPFNFFFLQWLRKKIIYTKLIHYILPNWILNTHTLIMGTLYTLTKKKWNESENWNSVLTFFKLVSTPQVGPGFALLTTKILNIYTALHFFLWLVSYDATKSYDIVNSYPTSAENYPTVIQH